MAKTRTSITPAPQKTLAKKSSILLRNVPDEVLAAITAAKIKIMTANPRRTMVSDSDAVFKLILKG
jgi:hypothetical protein